MLTFTADVFGTALPSDKLITVSSATTYTTYAIPGSNPVTPTIISWPALSALNNPHPVTAFAMVPALIDATSGAKALAGITA